MTECPTPEKGRYRSQAEAKKAQRRRYAGYGRQKPHLYPYECPSGEHWHLTHHTPEKQMATFDKNTKGAGLVATSNMFEDSNVRHVFTDQPLWIGRDICDAVGISKYRDAVAQLDADERVSVVVDTLGGPQNMTAVTEAGVWSLLLISRSPKGQVQGRGVRRRRVILRCDGSGSQGCGGGLL
ncbi:BRO-N domain-containing protein, partial [Mycobacteroides abscessus]|uniref:BRO-N domain-containing protein n=1 Tax=Mycobacteroides abscessus TaxID=36809 RepID=UPI0013FD200A